MEDPARAADVSAVAPDLQDLTSLVVQWASAAGFEVSQWRERTMILGSVNGINSIEVTRQATELARLAFEAGRAKGLEEAAAEAEHWQKISRPEHKCGQYIAGAIRSLAPAVPI